MTVSAHGDLITTVTYDFVMVTNKDKSELVDTGFIAGIIAATVCVLLGCVVILVTILMLRSFLLVDIH